MFDVLFESKWAKAKQKLETKAEHVAKALDKYQRAADKMIRASQRHTAKVVALHEAEARAHVEQAFALGQPGSFAKAADALRAATVLRRTLTAA